MKNIRYLQVKAGNLKNYLFVEEELSRIPPGRVRIQVKSVGLNFADVFACLGLYSATPKGSFSPGLEFSGIITDVGSDTKTSFQVGDEIIGVTRFGALSSFVDVEPAYLYTKPKEWSFEEAASFFVQALTAWYGLVELGRLTQEKLVLLQSAAGGVGLYSLQILHHFGADYCAVVGDLSKVSFLKSWGVSEEKILLRQKDPKKFFRDLQNFLSNHRKSGFDIVFDSVAGRYFKPQFDSLNRRGIYVLFGAADFMKFSDKPDFLWLAFKYLTFPRILPLRMIEKNQGIFGFNLIWLYDQIELFQKLIQDMQKVSWKKPLVGKVFEFPYSYEALKYLQSGKSVGKVVIKMEI
ncbi:MAG: zinc-binding dehydrogenase [Leptospiraceae bacterium]|nr:zinc-binding dehydrogenase [Leptospiraceae bacterium]MDW7976041.1 zinc-binding dehydrogenase [Leptospiraceae bacterium]